jgi:hypothetical protein
VVLVSVLLVRGLCKHFEKKKAIPTP